MPGPWLTDDDVRDRLAGVLNLHGGRSQLETFWDGIVPYAHAAGYNEVVAALLRRGYTIAQLDTWARRQEFEGHISLWWCLVEGESEREGSSQAQRATQVPKLLFKFDRREELQDLFLVDDAGLPLEPADGVKKILTGPPDTSKDIFQLDPLRPNPWEPGYRYRR